MGAGGEGDSCAEGAVSGAQKNFHIVAEGIGDDDVEASVMIQVSDSDKLRDVAHRVGCRILVKRPVPASQQNAYRTAVRIVYDRQVWDSVAVEVSGGFPGS